MKRKSLLYVMVVIVSLVLVACGGSSSDDAEETTIIGSDIEGATELTFWTFAGQHVDLFEDAAIAWNEEFPDRPVTLVAETYPFDQMHNNLLLALQSGSGAPDIVDIEISRFPNYLQGVPQMLPMNEHVEPVIDQFIEARFDIYAKDGQYYGMPTHVGASVMYYNTEIMEEAGVDIESIQTWDDYVEAGKQVVENTGKVMATVHTDDYLPMFQLVSQRGSDWFDENGNPTLDAPENIEVLQFLHDLIYVHEIAELTPGGEPHAEEFYAYMNEGEVASLAMPIWYMGRFLENMPDLEGKIAIQPLPAWEEGGFRSAGMGGTGTVVTNQTEHEELAKDFLAYAKLTERANEKLWTVLGFDPPRWDVWDNEVFKEDNSFYQFFGDGIFDVLLDIRDEINAINVTSDTPTVANEMNTNVFNDVLRQQTQTAEEALRNAQETIEASMQD
ncbi:ABC transporter substrate-binding protein [Alkalihalobacillus hemicellulosilyticus]|uniref:Alpha-arabinosides ABC transport system n=1 Tax=Halalkalibacter hemicellulosilyticusJCM 9152 TaxID=1236971 RepID=W4QEJ4_9BACI|nr:ABC transporter substrate-binding protein [Halalkalibacter hemicellulosilyticus]GAE29779.1 alpha-arabinosides ABC transport system [Halalkalibacter hemicellulosilyticusJCM 9152]